MEKRRPSGRRLALFAYFCSHFWLATPQEVLQADWQEVWHSPQPPVCTLCFRSRVSRVLIRSIIISPIRPQRTKPQRYIIKSAIRIPYLGLIVKKSCLIVSEINFAL